MRPNGKSICKLGKSKLELEIESYQEDIQVLSRMKEIYVDDTQNLHGCHYTEMVDKIEEQIRFCESYIKNLTILKN